MTHRNDMFEKISLVIEDCGKGDETYDNFKKAEDILAVLESLLAYTIYTVSTETDHIRDAAEESYINIKKQALQMMYKEKEENSKK